ncbi:MAG: hypothetical protein A2297_02995 [Elusimicrobia bacterium RIFOXYB2_FULL_48_7]|nr:MAG: hypothetical protein A2297_02995 [Elusimicrobia bacterium RIFOXYB2_FULL_48_7]
MKTRKLSLGIELSTQSAKMAVLDTAGGAIIYTGKIDYDSQFPEYGTAGGVLPSPDPEIRHTSPYLLVEALEHVFKKLKADSVDLSAVRAIKTDCMQHCTVYTNAYFAGAVANLKSSASLVSQIRPSFSRNTCPIWEDSSTRKEAETLTGLLRTKGGIIKLTGNRAELRFPAVQIMKWLKESPAEYRVTANIFLLSAFVTSVLSGRIAPVDTGDGWGTNLNTLNIRKPGWNLPVTKAIDSALMSKLGKITHYDHKVGTINKYFVKCYGVNPKAIVLCGTGDNPATLLGCGGRAVISLGSSYTVNGVMKKIFPAENGQYNVFGYTRGIAMALSCNTNGGKLHEALLKKCVTGGRTPGKNDWAEYMKMAGSPVLGPSEEIALPHKAVTIRALHLSQALSLKTRASHLSSFNEICIVGGSSKNTLLRQMITDAFGTVSYTIKNPDFAAPIGCAISGAREILGITYKEACKRFVQVDETSRLKPMAANKPVIKTLIQRYKKLEARERECIR